MLKIIAIQSDLHWENTTANCAMFEEKIAQISENVDVIVLPEMFTTGFSMNSTRLAEVPLLYTHKWMALIAAQKNALIIGSYIVNDKGQYFNRLLAVEPSGQYHIYNKRHLFRMGGEHEHYTAGNQRLIINWRGFRLCPMVCYDLRFPVWSRNQNNEYDLLIYVANWPAPRAQVWRTLLQARAIENQCYLVGVNRVGSDGQGLDYKGDSMIVDYKGNIITEGFSEAVILTAHLEMLALNDFKTKFPAYLDADKFDITT